MVEGIPWLQDIFPTIWHFVLVGFSIYVPLTMFMGYIDFKKISVPTDSTLVAKANPYSRDLAKAISLISEGKTEEARALLEQWY